MILDRIWFFCCRGLIVASLLGWLLDNHSCFCDGLSKSPGVVTADFTSAESPDPSGVVRLNESELPSERAADPSTILRVSSSITDNPGFTKGSSSAKIRELAIDSLPLKKLSDEQKQKLLKIVKDTGFFRRLPTVVFPADTECYNYFLDYPEAAVSIWREMGISRMQLRPTSPNFYTGDVGDGTVGHLEVLYRDAETVLVMCDGEYKSPFLKHPVKSQSALLLKSNSFRESDGIVYITHRADLFVAFPSQTVETVAKVLAPLTAPIADRSFIEVSMFLKLMSSAMEKRPEWVDQIAGRMSDLSPEGKMQLLAVTERINSRANPKVSLSDHSTDEIARRSGINPGTIPASNVRFRPLQSERTSQSVLFRR